MLKSRTLTIDISEHIEQDILNDSFKDQLETLRVAKFELAEKVYHDIYHKEEDLMRSLPDHYLPKATTFKVQFGQAQEGFTQLVMENEKSFPYAAIGLYGCPALKIYEDDHKFSIKFFDLKLEENKLKTKMKTARQEVRAIIFSNNTTKQLKEAWPEIKKYVEKHEQPPKPRRSLSPLISKVNEVLNLKEVK